MFPLKNLTRKGFRKGVYMTKTFDGFDVFNIIIVKKGVMKLETGISTKYACDLVSIVW